MSNLFVFLFEMCCVVILDLEDVGGWFEFFVVIIEFYCDLRFFDFVNFVDGDFILIFEIILDGI